MLNTVFICIVFKEEMKKQDEEALKAQEASKPSIVKTDTYKPEPAIDTKECVVT